jgi:hypothetical protein
MPELLERPPSEAEALLAEKLDRLAEAALAAVHAMEVGDPDLIAQAKRRLGLVLADL